MLLMILRGFFLLIVMAIALSYVPLFEAQLSSRNVLLDIHGPALLVGFLGLGLMVVGADILVTRKSLSAIGGIFFGLVVGMLAAYVLNLVANLVIENLFPDLGLREQVTATLMEVIRGEPKAVSRVIGHRDTPLLAISKLLVGVICCYLSISFVLQTKDDVRFVIPYVEFTKQTRGTRPLVLDTSVIIDGRIVDLCQTHVLDGLLVVPRYVLTELHEVADSSDKLKRSRGRRGLDVLNSLRSNDDLEVRIEEVSQETNEGPVDHRLLATTQALGGRLVTTDYNLSKIASLRGVQVLNINDVANALKPVVMPGEPITVRIIKPGEQAGQGVGYTDDGTMVVGEQCRDKMGQPVELVVTSVHQTSAGRMIFGKPADDQERA